MHNTDDAFRSDTDVDVNDPEAYAWNVQVCVF